MAKKDIQKIIKRDTSNNKFSKLFDSFILVLILLSVASIVLESVESINLKYSTYLEIFNKTAIIIFTIEYLLRIYISDITHPSSSRLKSALKFIFSSFGLIDLLAILPFYLPLVFGFDLVFIRTLRFFRFLRILKVSRYNNSMHLIWTVVKEKKSELYVTGFMTFIILFISSFLIYYVEGEAQPEKFPDILSAFWWAIATLTTVGYGDVYPITSLGKVISGVIAVIGIGLVALPTGIISAGFINKLDKSGEKIKCPHCGKEIELEK